MTHVFHNDLWRLDRSYARDDLIRVHAHCSANTDEFKTAVVYNLDEAGKSNNADSPGAVVAEWLRRQTWNLLGSARAGSNPADCDAEFYVSSLHTSCFMLVFEWKKTLEESEFVHDTDTWLADELR